VIPRDPVRDYANGNYMIQSTGRDVLGQAICNLDDQGYGEWLWLPIHDELVLEVDEGDADAACRILGDCMTMTVKGVEIPAEGEVVGTRWRGLT
jgi:DNA polymerase-1